jgi:hypothetical protein
MSKHDTPTKRHPKSGKRVDYTARTVAVLKELRQGAKAACRDALEKGLTRADMVRDAIFSTVPGGHGMTIFFVLRYR